MTAPDKTDLEQLCAKEDLSGERVAAIFAAVVSGEVPSAMLAGLLVALRAKGETIDEVSGAARALLDAAAPFPRPDYEFGDTAGTGGDGAGTLNLSTAVAFVAAACGLPVAKHGNRAVSSRCGSADVLEAAGVKLDVGAQRARAILDEVGVCFLFAPVFQPGLKHAIEARKALGVRTMMNRLGPLVNPARPPVQMTGVYDAALVRPTAEVLGSLGVKRALVIHGGGLDEVALHGPTTYARLNGGEVSEGELTPGELGLREAPISALAGGGPEENAALLKAVLSGEGAKAPTEAVAANAGCLLFTAGLVDSPKAGVERARDALRQGAPGRKLAALVEATNA